MFRIVLYTLSILYQNIFIRSQQEKFDVQWDEMLRRNDENLKCGVQNKNSINPELTPRIINGRRTSNIRYPWMAETIYIIFDKFDNQFDSTPRDNQCTGSVISERSIITAASCICLTPVDNQRQKEPLDVVCLEETDVNEPRNQNRGNNQVHYAIGPGFTSLTLGILRQKKNQIKNYKRNIKAYLYKYEPQWWMDGTEEDRMKKKSFYKNGNIGLIVDENGINLKIWKASPICLPTIQTFKKDDSMTYEKGIPSGEQILKVKVVGREQRYLDIKKEKKPNDAPFKKNKKVTSCMTNEGVVRKSGNTQANFLPCMPYDLEGQHSCTLIDDAKVLQGSKEVKGYGGLLSTDVEIEFVPKVSIRDKGPRMIIKIKEDDRCQKLTKSVGKAYDRMIMALQINYQGEDTAAPARVLVFGRDGSGKDWETRYAEWEKGMSPNVAYCYNLGKLAEFGICETDNQFYNFGFCSPGCQKLHPQWDDRVRANERYYWELRADFYDSKIDEDDEIHNLFPRKIENHYKCVVPRFPRATIGVFVENEYKELEFKGMKKDPNDLRVSDYLGSFKAYNAAGPGDAGAPVSKTVSDLNGDRRHVLIAVLSQTSRLNETIQEKLNTKCISDASKITRDVVKWIKDLDSGGASSGVCGQCGRNRPSTRMNSRAISNSTSSENKKFEDYLVDMRQTCGGEDMIGSPTRDLTMEECFERCDTNAKCKFFFFTDQCIGNKACPKGSKGCCALFGKCKNIVPINKQGHTCTKGTI